MKAQGWLRKIRQAVGASLRAPIGHGDALDELRDGYGGSSSVLRGLTGRSMEMAEVQAEVAAESRGEILMVSRCDVAVRRLLAHMRGQPAVPSAGPTYREGFFTLTMLPDAADDRSVGLEMGWATAEWLELAREADVLLYVFRQDAGWQADDARWYARLHATGRPLVLVEVDLPLAPPSARSGQALPTREGERSASCAARERERREQRDAPGSATALPAGDRAVQVCLSNPAPGGDALPADVIALVERILAQRPKLGIPLAQEIPGCRPLIAQRAIRSGMLMTTLLGAEPIPLLDLPLQVALNWKLALQLAAIHGHPGLDHRSREMIGTLLWNLALRYATQQVLKLAPVLGWVGSAALSGAGTWVLGNALVRYYQGSGVRDQRAGSRGQGTACPGEARGVRGLMAAVQNGETSRKWQGARRTSHAGLAEVKAMLAQWRQDARMRFAGLRGRLAAKTAAFGKRGGVVAADEPGGGSHV